MRAYDVRIAWIYGGFGDDSDYPGKIRALARMLAGDAAQLADIIFAALWTAVPTLPAPVALLAPTAFPVAWPSGWSPLCPSDRLTARRTTGPPARGPWSSAPGVCVSSP
jgi:hypothetical protein